MSNLLKIDGSTIELGSFAVPIVNSNFEALERDLDIFVVARAGVALTALDAVYLTSVTITGSNISLAVDSVDVVGTSTTFTTDLIVGDLIRIGGKFFTVLEITDNTHLVVTFPNNTGGALSNNPSSVATRFQFDKAQRVDDVFTKTCIGIAITAYSSGTLARAKVHGLLYGFSGLTTGEPYIVSSTAGSLELRTSAAILGNYQDVGFAVSAQMMFLNIKNPTLHTPGIHSAFVQTASVTVASTASITTLVGSGLGSATLAADSLKVGSSIRLKASGYLSTDAAVGPTMTWTFQIGGSTIMATSAITLSNGLSNVGWRVEVEATVRTAGAGGTLFAQGVVFFNDTAHQAFMVNTATDSINTTATKLVDLLATWGTSDADNTITCSNLSIEVLNRAKS